MRCSSPLICPVSRMVEKCDMPSDRTSQPGPLAGVSMLPHHMCATSCAVTQNAAFDFGLLSVRKPIASENVMFVAGPIANVASAGNSLSLRSRHGYGANHFEYHVRAPSSASVISSMLYVWVG